MTLVIYGAGVVSTIRFVIPEEWFAAHATRI
jgi:hypothetical protein